MGDTTGSSTSIGAVLRTLFVVVAAAALLWQIMTKQIAQAAFEADDPAVALRLAPGLAEAQSALAAYALNEDRRGDAQRLATGALRSAPLSPVAIRTLMIAAELDGDGGSGRELLSRAARLGWRDEPTQLAAFAAALQAGRMSNAAIHLDAIARTSTRPALVFPLIDGWLSDAAFERALATRLSRNPAWRHEYLTAISKLGEAAAGGRLRVARSLSYEGKDQARDELLPQLRRLLASGDYAEAYQLWRNLIANRSLLRGSSLYDSDFGTAARGTDSIPFEWTLVTSDTTSAAPDLVDGHRALRVETDGKTDIRIAEQMLPLPPGRYSFSVDVDSAPGQAKTGFRWRLSCGPGREPLPPLGTRTASAPRAPSQYLVRFSFDVPANGCPYQFVELHLASTESADSATYFFSKASIR